MIQSIALLVTNFPYKNKNFDRNRDLIVVT